MRIPDELSRRLGELESEFGYVSRDEMVRDAVRKLIADLEQQRATRGSADHAERANGGNRA